jgi:hypothetical protein
MSLVENGSLTSRTPIADFPPLTVWRGLPVRPDLPLFIVE